MSALTGPTPYGTSTIQPHQELPNLPSSSNTSFTNSSIVSLGSEQTEELDNNHVFIDSSNSGKSEETDNNNLVPNMTEIEQKMLEYRETYNYGDIMILLNRWGVGLLDKEGGTNMQKLKNDCTHMLSTDDMNFLCSLDLDGEKLRAKGIHDDLSGYIECGVDKEILTALIQERIEELDKIEGKENPYTKSLWNHLAKLMEEEGLTEKRKNGIRNDVNMICIEQLRKLVITSMPPPAPNAQPNNQGFFSKVRSFLGL